MYLTQFWDTDPVPVEIEPLLASHVRCNPDLTHRLFSRRQAEAYIGAHFGPRELKAFRACAVPAMQADYFRYCATVAEGGFYSDADAHCLSPLRPLLGSHAGVVFRRGNANVVNGLFAFSQAGNPLARTALEIATLGIERRISESVWVTTGPGIFTYLHLLSVMTAAERSHLDYDFIGPDVTRSMRLCHEVACTEAGGIDALFDGVRVAGFAELDGVLCDEDLPYKLTGVHWTNWTRSIFNPDEELARAGDYKAA